MRQGGDAKGKWSGAHPCGRVNPTVRVRVYPNPNLRKVLHCRCNTRGDTPTGIMPPSPGFPLFTFRQDSSGVVLLVSCLTKAYLGIRFVVVRRVVG